MRIKPAPFIILGICCAYFIFSTSALRAESLEEMISAAKKYDVRYLGVHAEYEATAFRVDQSRSKLLPSLSTSGNLTKNNLKIDYNDPRFVNFDREYITNEWSAQLVQPLFHGEDWAGLAKAQQAREQSLCNLRQAEAELVLRLAQAYYNVLFAKENVVFLEAEKRALVERVRAAQGLHRAGAVSGPEALQIQAQLEVVAAGILEAQWELANQERVLESLVGPNMTGPENVLKNEVENSWGTLDDWLQKSAMNPQVRAAKISLEIARQEERNVSSGFWPGMDAVGVYQEAQLGPSASLPIETRNRNSSIGVRFTWALFSGMGTVAEGRAARKNREKAEYEWVAMEREVGIQIAEAYSGIHSGFEQIKALEQGVRVSEEVVRAMEKGSAVGARTLAHVLEARQKWLEAKKNRNQAFYKLLLNQIKLQLAVSEYDF